MYGKSWSSQRSATVPLTTLNTDTLRGGVARFQPVVVSACRRFRRRGPRRPPARGRRPASMSGVNLASTFSIALCALSSSASTTARARADASAASAIAASRTSRRGPSSRRPRFGTANGKSVGRSCNGRTRGRQRSVGRSCNGRTHIIVLLVMLGAVGV